MERKAMESLRRPINEMPDFIRNALEERALIEAYRRRPAYQQNDYVGWVMRARRPETQAKRLATMLDELERGEGYMGCRPEEPC